MSLIRRYNEKFPLFVVILVAFLDWMGIGLVYPMFSSMFFQPSSPFFDPHAADATRGMWLGLLLAAMPIAQFVSSPIIGALSDQKGRKPLLKFSLLLAAAGYFVSLLGVYCHSLVLLLLSRIIIGIGAGTLSVVMAVIADISTPQQKAKRFGLVSMSFGIGFMVGPFLGGFLSDPNSWSYGSFDKPFLFAGLLTLINFILLIYFFKETHHTRRNAEYSLSLGLRNLKKALVFPGLRALFIAVFFFAFAWSFYWEFSPVTWIKQYDLTTAEIGNVYAYGAAFYALSAGLLIRPIVNRFPSSKVLFWALTGLGSLILVLLFHFPFWVLLFLFPIQQYLLALIFPTLNTTISNSVSGDIQGETMGILQSVESAGFALSPLLSGGIVGANPTMPVIAGGTMMLIAAFILVRGCPKILQRS